MPVCLEVQLEMMTRDLSALKNGTKNKKFPLGGMTESEPARRENDDVIEMKTRLDDVIKGIKGLVTMSFLIPSPTVKEATCLGRNPRHMVSANRQITLFSHRWH